MENPFFTSVPLRYREIFTLVKSNLRFISFRSMYYSEDKGWRYHWDKYKGQDEEGFPETTALKKFENNMKIIEKNFPVISERYFLLKALKRNVFEFNLIDEKKWEEDISFWESKDKIKYVDTVSKKQREIKISQQIREAYIKKYNEYEYVWSGREQKDKEEQDFLNAWFDQSVTLEHWEKFKNLDLWFFLNQLDPTDEEIEEIENHQYYLFQHKIKKTLEFLLGKYSTRETNKRIEILQSHIDSIENFFDKGFDTDGNLEKLKAIYRGIAVDKKDLMNAYSKVIIQEFDYQEDFLLSVKDTFKAHPVFLATLFYEYKKEAQHLVKELSKPSRKAVKKAPRFSVKAPHKTEWLRDLIIQLQFKVEILREPSTPDKLFKLLTAADYNEINDPIQLNCETKQFVYIIDKLKPKFSKLTYANIERSKKFKSCEDNWINADNMSNSKTDYPKDKEEIDAVFNDFMK